MNESSSSSLSSSSSSSWSSSSSSSSPPLSSSSSSSSPSSSLSSSSSSSSSSAAAAAELERIYSVIWMGKEKGRGRGQGIHASLSESFNTLESLVGGKERRGAGGNWDDLDVQQYLSRLRLFICQQYYLGGWEEASWRLRGRGNFFSRSFTALGKGTSIGREMEGSPILRWGGGTESEMVACNGLNLYHIPAYALEDDDLPD